MLGFRTIIVGLIFLIDIEVCGFDLLPDISGYILLFIGFSRLIDENINFEKGQKFIIPLVFLSIYQLINFPSSYFDNNTMLYMLIVVNIIIFILGSITVYYLCKGISELIKCTNNKLYKVPIKIFMVFVFLKTILSSIDLYQNIYDVKLVNCPLSVFNALIYLLLLTFVIVFYKNYYLYSIQ